MEWKKWMPIVLPQPMQTPAQEVNIFVEEASFVVEAEFRGTNDVLVLDFGPDMISYEVMNEGKKLRFYDELERMYGPFCWGDSPLHELRNSRYLEWLKTENRDENNEKWLHFFIISENIVEVIGKKEPNIYIRKNPYVKGLKRVWCELIIKGVEQYCDQELLQNIGFDTFGNVGWVYSLPWARDYDEASPAIEWLIEEISPHIDVIKNVIAHKGVSAGINLLIHRINEEEKDKVLSVNKHVQQFVKQLPANVEFWVENMDKVELRKTIKYKDI